MKAKLALKSTLFTTSVLLTIGSSKGALSITNTSAYIEEFNSSTATIPANWTGNFQGSGAAITYGSASPTSNTYYALRPNSESANYAFGGKVAANSGNPNGTGLGTLTLAAVNNTGGDIPAFAIDFSYLQYTAENRASTLSFSYSLDGTEYITTGLTFTTGSSSYTAMELDTSFHSTSSILSQLNSAILTLGTPLENEGEIWFRFTWATASGAGHNAHLGVDDFYLAAIPEPTTALLGALGMLGLLRRRR